MSEPTDAEAKEYGEICLKAMKAITMALQASTERLEVVHSPAMVSKATVTVLLNLGLQASLFFLQVVEGKFREVSPDKLMKQPEAAAAAVADILEWLGRVVEASCPGKRLVAEIREKADGPKA